MNFYIRLLSYKEACEIIKFINNMVGCIAGVTPGGVSVTCGDYIDEELIRDELFNNYPRFEITQDHPEQVKKRIVDKLGLKHDSNN